LDLSSVYYGLTPIYLLSFLSSSRPASGTIAQIKLLFISQREVVWSGELLSYKYLVGWSWSRYLVFVYITFLLLLYPGLKDGKRGVIKKEIRGMGGVWSGKQEGGARGEDIWCAK
jgi:hypothetical protein